MGQYFMLMNLDKCQSKHLGKFGELYLYTKVAMYLCDKDPQSSWAGDRLILIGDYAGDFPTGVLTDFEEKFTPRFRWATGFPKPGRGPMYTRTSVLRNLCSREYIKAESFPGTDDHPGLGEALMPKIIWTTDSSLSLNADIGIKGPWAGARIDIVEFSVVKDDPTWKDITEVVFFDFYDIWSSDMNGPDNCTCDLCSKYRDQQETFYETWFERRRQERENPHVPRVETVAISISTDAGHGEQTPVVRDDLSRIEALPNEIKESIFANLPTKDLAACAVTSKALSYEASRGLYASVRLVTAEQTTTLLETLKMHPEYAKYIKELRVVTMAHWESLQVAHDILKRLPALTALEFAPCWFSYGDLPYWEYPFELKSLKSGLVPDEGFDRFRSSQKKLAE